MTRRLVHMVMLFVLAAAVPAAAQVSIDTAVDADSVTVGERFTVTYELSYPDTLRMLPPETIESGTARVIAFDFDRERTRDGAATRRGRLTAIGLDLEQATIPALPFAFLTPGGDTLRESADAVTLPVRLIAPDSVSMASLEPLKDPWEAPRNLLVWILAAAAALAAVAFAVWWWRRRKRRPAQAAPEVVLPPDHVALTELTRVERLGLLERGEFKEYYTLVVDALRRYLEARYGIDAMDRTSGEVLDDARAHRDARDIPMGPLEGLLREADLVKFARHVPTVENGNAAMHAAREFVSATAPRHVPQDTPEEEAA